MDNGDNDVINNGQTQKEHNGCTGCFIVLLVGVVIVVILGLTGSDESTDNGNSNSGSSNYDSSVWDHAAGHMYSGVRLYIGSGANKEYFGEIQCFRGGSGGSVYIINFAGSPLWAKRDALLTGPYYVRRDDPAVNSPVYYDCDK